VFNHHLQKVVQLVNNNHEVNCYFVAIIVSFAIWQPFLAANFTKNAQWKSKLANFWLFWKQCWQLWR
jgi:hypothetical protein